MTRGGEVAKLMAPLLAELSFRKCAGAIFTCELSSDTLGWLGLNTAVEHRRPGEVEVNPVVGVRHQAVERIVSECRGAKFHQYVPPTVSTPIGYLFPEPRYRSWIFGSEGADAAVARELRDAIHDHALPFMRATASLPELCSQVDQGIGIKDQLAYRRPVAWLLAGDVETARAILDESLATLEGMNPYAEDFRRFSECLRQRIDAAASPQH